MKKEKEELSVICCKVVVLGKRGWLVDWSLTSLFKGKRRDESTEGNSVHDVE